MEFFIIDVSDRNESSDLVRALQRRFISEEKEEEETNKNKNSHNKSLYYVRMDLSEVYCFSGIETRRLPPLQRFINDTSVKLRFLVFEAI